MTEKIEPFQFNSHAGDLGHSMVIGPTSSGKTAWAEQVKLWSVGHPGESTSVAQADDNDDE